MKFKNLIVLVALFAVACSTDSDGGLNVKSTRLTVEENPTAGQLLTTLGSSGAENLQFSIVSQSPADAFLLNTTNGEVRVKDPDLFDFEINPELTLSVLVSDGELEKTVDVDIQLTDVDDIFFHLSESRDRYLSASPGEWIAISSTEYNTLREELNEIAVAGLPDSPVNFGGPSSGTVNYIFDDSDYTSVYNIEESAIPQGGYVFAFKVYWNLSSGWEDAPQVKTADRTPLNGLQNLGGPLPQVDTSLSYYVLRGNNVTASEDGMGYLGFYSSNRTAYYQGFGNGNTYMGDGDLTQIVPGQNVNSTPFLVQYQALTSTQKQWD